MTYELRNGLYVEVPKFKEPSTKDGVRMPPQCECGSAWVTISADSSFTCVGFNGHDDNCECRILWCERGCRRTVSIRRVCDPRHYDDMDRRGEVHEPCDWKGQEDCPCHHYLKLDAWPAVAEKPSEYERDDEDRGSAIRYTDGI